MSHVEVDHVLRVGPLDRDGKRLEGMEGEGNQAAHGVADRPSQQARLDLKLQQARVSSVKPGGGTESFRTPIWTRSFLQSEEGRALLRALQPTNPIKRDEQESLNSWFLFYFI